MYVGKRLRGMPNDLLLMHIYSVLWFHVLVGSILHFFLQQEKDGKSARQRFKNVAKQ